MHPKKISHTAQLLVALSALTLGAGDALAIGGGGGSAWADNNCSGKPVSGVVIRAGSRVDGVQFGYRNGGWASAHGSTGGSGTTVSLDADETFTEVRYRSGGAIDQLTFVTSKGRIYGPYGGGGGTPGVFKGPDGGSLTCVSGRSGSSIDALEFTWLPPTSKPSDQPKRTGTSSSANCTAASYAKGSGGTSGGNVQGGGSVGSGVVCTDTTGYADKNGYANVQLSCQSGMFASADGQAGANGVAVCADASVGTSCSATVAGGGTTQYGGGGGSAGVSGGGTGAGMCGGVTFTAESVNIAMCGSLALDVGVDVCINGSVNYANIYGRAEPFASRALAQAAKCASASNGAECSFTLGDMLANSAAPFIGRTADFFDSKKTFRTGAAIDVWNDSRASVLRTGNYTKSIDKYVGNNLKNTTYSAIGQVLNSSNQLVDIGNSSLETGKNIVNKAGKELKNLGNKANPKNW
jgi:Jacalin-like lectin domain